MATSSLTEHSPARTRSRICRRLGSASTSKTEFTFPACPPRHIPVKAYTSSHSLGELTPVPRPQRARDVTTDKRHRQAADAWRSKHGRKRPSPAGRRVRGAGGRSVAAAREQTNAPRANERHRPTTHASPPKPGARRPREQQDPRSSPNEP